MLAHLSCLLIHCLTQVHPCYCGSHRGPALPGDLSASPGTDESCGTASVISAGREGMLLTGVCISFPTQLCGDSARVRISQSVLGLLALGYEEIAWPPGYCCSCCLSVGIPLTKDESLLKSRNLWDQICAFSVL